jgi:hypothetical protein
MITPGGRFLAIAFSWSFLSFTFRALEALFCTDHARRMMRRGLPQRTLNPI